MLENSDMTYCKPSKSKGELFVKGLLPSDCPTTQDQKNLMKDIPYRQLVGSLQHLATHTRPDIAHEATTLSKFQQNPGMPHWNALKQLLRFLKGTYQFGLTLGGTCNNVLTGYVDAANNRCRETGRSTGGYVLFLGQSPICWKSSWYDNTYTSSSEAEYAALYHGTSQSIWLSKLLKSLGYTQKDITIKEDNQGTINYAYSKDYGGRMKHMDPKFHFVREKLQDQSIRLEYIPGTENTADIFTKTLRGTALVKHSTSLGLTKLATCLHKQCQVSSMDGNA